MSIHTVCPKCRASYQLADQQAGKKVRCKQCQGVFVAGESPSRQVQSRPPTAAGRVRRDDEEDVRDELQKKSKSGGGALKWIVGGIVAGVGVLFLMCGGLGYYVYSKFQEEKQQFMASSGQPLAPNLQPGPPRPQGPPPIPQPPAVPQPVEQPIVGQPVVQPANPPPAKADTPPPGKTDNAQLKTDNPPPATANNDRLSTEAHDRAKRATVYLRVEMADGSKASGSGFFGCKEARNIILTNAHVVGMLSPDSARPRSIEVVVNSGQSDEWTTSARVLGVDRTSDLAVLDIGEAPKPTPAPLAVKAAAGLRELDTLYILGFPFGEQLGKEITVSETKVSSLRKTKKGDALERVQVGAGMNPGNSGGPLIDNSGVVVGVAVAGIPGRAINFAIPGERVHAILDGRISELAFQTPYYGANDKTVIVPAYMEMIDPRNLIKEVGVEIWTGDKPADAKSGHRPPSRTQPAAQSGDSPRSYFKLKYHAGQGSGDIPLAELPTGKVYWKQPRWVNNKGETYWALAEPFDLPTQPVHRKPAKLVLRYKQNTSRRLDLSIETSFKVSESEDADSARIRNVVSLTETVMQTGGPLTLLRLTHRSPPRRELIVKGKEPEPHPMLEDIRRVLPNLVTLVQVDNLGKIKGQALDPIGLLKIQQSKPEHLEELKDFHDVIQEGLESLSGSLPPGGTVDPLKSWTDERRLPIDTPGKSELGKLNVTFTYLGVRNRDGRDEGVINMHGLVRGNNEGIGGKADGVILVDLTSGQTLMATSTVVLQLKAVIEVEGKRRPVRLIATMKSTLQRKLS
jgi:predicted Zn finger-like uncharacterized protein